MALAKAKPILQVWQRWLPYAHQRVLLLLAGGTAIAVGVTAYLSYQAVREIAIHNLQANARLEVERDVGKIDRWLAERLAEVETIANSPTARSLDWQQIKPYLNAERQRLEHFHLLALLDQQGNFYTDSGKKSPARDREFFRRAIDGETNVSDPIVSRSTGKTQVSFVAPIRPQGSAEPQGAIACPVPIALLARVVKDLNYGPNSYAFLLNSEGVPVVHPDLEQVGTEEQEAPSLLEASDRGLAGLARRMLEAEEPHIDTFTLAGERTYVAYMPLQQADWSVALVIPAANIEGQLTDLNRLAALIGGLLAATMGASVLIVASLRDRALLAQLHSELQERKRIEGDLRISEERFRQLAENVREIVYLFAGSFQEMLYINPAFAAIAGRPPLPLNKVADAWLAAVHPDDGDRLRQALATADCRNPLKLEYRLCRPDGDIRWLHMRHFPVRNKFGKVYRIAGLAEDITARKETEQLQAELREQLEARVAERTAELSEANRRLKVEIVEREQAEREVRLLEERFRTLFHQAPVGIAACDLSGRCLEVNPALGEILGASSSAIAARPLSAWFSDSPPNAVAAYFARLATGEALEVLTCEQRSRRCDGREIWLSLTLAPVSAGQELAAIAAIEDITERKETEKQKEEFLAIASHELRTPLATLVSSLELIRTGLLGKLDERGQQMLEFACLEAQRLVRLSNQLLSYQRLRFGRASGEWCWFEVRELAERACRAVAEQAAENQIDLQLEVAAGLRVHGDRDALERVAINLLDNAIKFSPAGSPVWLRAFAIHNSALDAQPVAVRVQVEDRGPGIAADQLERIFKPFEQGRQAARNGKPGTGLGLAICWQIVQQHGSQLEVSSELGRGSCFSFALHLSTPPTAPSPSD